MAIPEVEEIGQVDDDLQKLALAQSYFQMSESAAWKDLMERIDGLVAAAKQEMFSSLESDPQKILLEKLRWQQRELFHAAISQIVSSQLATREAILEDMKENHADTGN